MLGLTTLGIIHTAISLIAVVTGLIALIRDKVISIKNGLGQTYLLTTLLTAATGLGIFQHGGFGKPHVLSILTIIALIVGTVAATTNFYGRFSRVTNAIAFTATYLFHLIPGITESLTRLPPGAPIASSADDPFLKPFVGAFVVLFLIVVTLQIRWLRQHPLQPG
jgi:uncharacterized membrane protein